jgi:hypothetical protein
MNLLKASVILLAIVSIASSAKLAGAVSGPSSQGKGMSPSENWTDSSQIHFKPIGVVKSPFRDQAGTPIQPVYAQGTKGKVIVFDAYKKHSRIWMGFREYG